ncbi:MAG: hypothetical protein ACFWUE_06235 [Xylanivirga thermophila]|jgi:uncharacterized protein YbaR (Trm112 family)
MVLYFFGVAFNYTTNPFIKNPKKFEYKILLSEHLSKTNRKLKPVRRHGGINTVPTDSICPQCGAPYEYLYDNNGGRGQLLCKVCNFRFVYGKDFDSNTLICPYCGHALSKKKSHKFFNIHKCVNMKCSFYLHSLEKLFPDDLERCYSFFPLDIL